MKKIKYIIILFISICLIIGLMLFKKSNKDICLLLGNNIDVKEYLLEQNIEINDSFNSKTMKSKDLMYYLENNALVENQSIISLIKNSKYVFISIGLNDLLSRISISKYERKVIYDDDNISLMFELLKSNLQTIVDIILLANKTCKIYLQDYDNCFRFDKNNDLINRLSDIIKSIDKTNYLDCSLDNLNCYDKNFDVYINEYGKQKIAEKISQKIIANT